MKLAKRITLTTVAILALGALLFVGSPARAGCSYSDPGCAIPTETASNEDFLGDAVIDNYISSYPTHVCHFYDHFTAIVIQDHPTLLDYQWYGEKRAFENSDTGTTIRDEMDITAKACANKSQRTRWGMWTMQGIWKKATYFYDIKGRWTDCSFRDPVKDSISSCTDRMQIAWNGCDACPETFAATEDCSCVYMTPILVSLIPGQRVDVSKPEDGPLFDLNGDGTRSLTAWPVDVANVGFLYYKAPIYRNTGMALFGNMTGFPNGFKQLATYDDKQLSADKSTIVGPPDGVINAKDYGAWPHLGVWRDLNRDGIQQDEEWQSLEELGIETLELNYTTSERKDGDGNRFPFVARYFKKGDPQPYFMVDYIAAVKKAQ